MIWHYWVHDLTNHYRVITHSVHNLTSHWVIAHRVHDLASHWVIAHSVHDLKNHYWAIAHSVHDLTNHYFLSETVIWLYLLGIWNVLHSLLPKVAYLFDLSVQLHCSSMYIAHCCQPLLLLLLWYCIVHYYYYFCAGGAGTGQWTTLWIKPWWTTRPWWMKSTVTSPGQDRYTLKTNSAESLTKKHTYLKTISFWNQPLHVSV